jgi:hypothetical protein
MPYKRFSILVDIFYPSAGTVFSKKGFQQPRDLSPTIRDERCRVYEKAPPKGASTRRGEGVFTLIQTIGYLPSNRNRCDGEGHTRWGVPLRAKRGEGCDPWYDPPHSGVRCGRRPLANVSSNLRSSYSASFQYCALCPTRHRIEHNRVQVNPAPAKLRNLLDQHQKLSSTWNRAAEKSRLIRMWEGAASPADASYLPPTLQAMFLFGLTNQTCKERIGGRQCSILSAIQV